MLQRRTRLEHTAAQLSGHCCREQVGGSAGISCAVTKIDGACPNAQLHFFFFILYIYINKQITNTKSLPPDLPPAQWRPRRRLSGQDVVCFLFLWEATPSGHPAGHTCVSSALLRPLRHGSDCWSNAVRMVSDHIFCCHVKCHVVDFVRLDL